MKWFRQYAEFATDPKVQMLPESYQRRLVMLFCFKCDGSVTSQDSEIAFQLRISDDEWQNTRKVFIEKGFIDENNQILNWDKRQYKSDSSAERTKNYRNKKRDVTVTPPDTESDTDNISNKKPAKIKLADLSISHIADWLAEKKSEGRYLEHDPQFVLEKFKDYCKSKNKKYDDYVAAYRNAFDWEKCQPQGKKNGSNQQNYGQSFNGGQRKSQTEKLIDGINRVAAKYGTDGKQVQS